MSQSHLSSADLVRILSSAEIIITLTRMTEEIEPHILKKFEIIEKLGKGAYGIVWKAIDRKLKQVVALKKVQSASMQVFDAFHNATDAQRTFR